MITPEQLKNDLEICEKATPWRNEHIGTGVAPERMRHIQNVSHSHNRTPYIPIENAEFIATFNPSHVKELLTYIGELEVKLEEATDERDEFSLELWRMKDR